ncbi:hypothetical protein ACFVSW_00410 [Neobacillus sp. NPDC058068]|uniref:hypothetical protein n=1 Tax=Neobacillus sp. NPDC058068 TaxID=3346325 RepID=UPI0036DAD98D
MKNLKIKKCGNFMVKYTQEINVNNCSYHVFRLVLNKLKNRVIDIVVIINSERNAKLMLNDVAEKFGLLTSTLEYKEKIQGGELP